MSQLFAVFSADPEKPTEIGVKLALSSAILRTKIDRLRVYRRTAGHRTLLGTIRTIWNFGSCLAQSACSGLAAATSRFG